MKTFTVEEYKEYFRINYPDYELLDDYPGRSLKPFRVRCKKHDFVFNTTQKRLKAGNRCQKCYDERRNSTTKITQEEFLTRAHDYFGDLYIYNKTDVNNRDEKGRVIITCRKHGDFKTKPSRHINDHYGCKKCANEKNGFNKRLTQEEFEKRERKVHGTKYRLDKTVYITTDTPICLICDEHGEFWQTPESHLQGTGCPVCNEPIMERQIRVFCEEHNIKIIRQKKFSWLGLQSLDFYLPEYNIGIECQGGQHFIPVEHFGGEDAFFNSSTFRCK